MAEKEYIDRLEIKPLFDERYHTAFIQEKTRENPEFWHGVCAGVNWGLNTIMDTHAADVIEIVHGEWVHVEMKDEDWGGNYHKWICSCCSYSTGSNPNEMNYCPSCGAKMDGGNTNESIHM